MECKVVSNRDGVWLWFVVRFCGGFVSEMPIYCGGVGIRELFSLSLPEKKQKKVWGLRFFENLAPRCLKKVVGLAGFREFGSQVGATKKWGGWRFSRIWVTGASKKKWG